MAGQNGQLVLCVIPSMLGQECAGKSQSSPSPSHQAPHTSPPASSHPPTFPSPHPPTVTVHPPIVRDASHLDLFYEDEDDDDLFTLSTDIKSDGPPNKNLKGDHLESKLPPGGQNFNKNPLEGNHSGGQIFSGDDKLGKLRRELEQEIRERSASCEDGGEFVTCVHAVLEEGGVFENRGWSVTPIRTIGEERGTCEDGGRCVTQVHVVREEGGACEDGGRCVTQLHMVNEEGIGQDVTAKDSIAKCSDRDKGTTASTIPSPHDVYTNADVLAMYLQTHKEGQEEKLMPSQDLPDGAMLSRPIPPPAPAPEPEEEEEVVFPGLVPLFCRCYYGDEEKMKELKDNAGSILTQAISVIHSALSESSKYCHHRHDEKG